MRQLCAQAQRSPPLRPQFSGALAPDPRRPDVLQSGRSPFRLRMRALQSLFMAPAGSELDALNSTRETNDMPSPLTCPPLCSDAPDPRSLTAPSQHFYGAVGHWAGMGAGVPQDLI